MAIIFVNTRTLELVRIKIHLWQSQLSIFSVQDAEGRAGLARLRGLRRRHRRQEDPVFLLSGAQRRSDAAAERPDHDGREGKVFRLGQASSGPVHVHLEITSGHVKIVSCDLILTDCYTNRLTNVYQSSLITSLTN